MNEPHKCMSAGTVEAAMRWIYENDRIECFDCDPPHGAEIIHVGHQKTIARGPSAMKAKEALAMLSAAQATLWPDIKQLHDAIAECIGREGLTYSGIRRAAKRVQELYAATIAARPAAAPVDQERLAELQNEAGMYKSLYENAIAQRSSAERAQALRLLMAEDERQSKLHDLLETIREQIRTGVEPEHRPGGLFKNIQDAVYAMRGRTRLMDDGAITKIFDGQQEAPNREQIARTLAYEEWPLAEPDERQRWTDRHWMKWLRQADAVLALSRPQSGGPA
jgi:hypothetical protein